MDAHEWLAGLAEERLSDLEDAISRERAKRHIWPPALPIDAVDAEVERLLAIQAARRKKAAEDWEAHILGCLKRRKHLFEIGRLGMCSCRECLRGYTMLTVSRMCDKGQWQFRQDANAWHPWVP